MTQLAKARDRCIVSNTRHSCHAVFFGYLILFAGGPLVSSPVPILRPFSRPNRSFGIQLSVFGIGFYRAMHFSAKRDIAIACRLTVCPFVCLASGKRLQCGPVLRYKDAVKVNLKQCGIDPSALGDDTQDRSAWRTLFHEAVIQFEDSRVEALAHKTRKLCYRKDDRAMRAI